MYALICRPRLEPSCHLELRNLFQPKLKSPPKRARLEQVNQEAESSASSAEESESSDNDLTATPGETSSSSAKQAPTCVVERKAQVHCGQGNVL